MPPSALVSTHALRRLVLVSVVLLLAVSALGLTTRPAVAGDAPARDEQLRFMWAMAGQESGWDYYARNSSSGAFGKYQIMPFNWPVWAQQYLGHRWADQTPWNQEQVAYGKLGDLHAWLGSWKRVAYWWLTGSSEPDQKKWSAYAKGYVASIMALRKEAPERGLKMPARTSSRAVAGDWRRSGSGQHLRLKAGGRTWPEGGWVRDGQVLKVRSAKTTKPGVRWIKVVTANGRLGWLKQTRTLPARKPAAPERWRDVRDRGAPASRAQIRPRPR